MSLRTHTCGELRLSHQGQPVTLCGWVHARRDHGGVLFLDLRDRWGLAQLVARPEKKEVFQTAERLRGEFVIRASGTVQRRPPETENKKLATGAIEVILDSLEILASSPQPLPFEISEYAPVSEETRLKHRALDLRREKTKNNLYCRHRMNQAIRGYLNEKDFWEIETPILTKSTPEGARDFLVPSRLSPGRFYALPQSPQLFKQTLMASGIERYYQIARCFRDEDLRADRQPEFTQLDLEMSFIEEEDILTTIEGLMARVWKEVLGIELVVPFPRFTHAQAAEEFGSDKPDLRYAPRIQDCSAIFGQSNFQVFAQPLQNGGRVRALKFPGGGELSRQELEKLTEKVRALGAQGLAWIKWQKGGPESPIVKFLSSEEKNRLEQLTQPREGDILFFSADRLEQTSLTLSFLRQEVVHRLGLPAQAPWCFVWITGFPLLEWSMEEKRWVSCHHPFTSPDAESLRLIQEAKDPQKLDLGKLRARAYDLVLNGVEIGGGSLRIHRRDIQEKVFELLGIPLQEAQTRFGFFLQTLGLGAPPHGGIALGLDRTAALLCGEDSIREVIAFPKTQKGTCPFTEAPAGVSPQQLKELRIKNL